MTRTFHNASMKTLLLAALAVLAACPLPAQEHPDRSAPPKLGPPPSLALPAIQHLKLSNGVQVVLLEKHEVPLVQINLVLRAGAALEQPADLGLASMTAAMLMEGAGQKSSLELADAIDFLGASINTGAGAFTSSVALHTPVAKLDAALQLFADVALRPSFPQKELDRLRQERLTAILQWHDQPTAIASIAAAQTVFGAEHPYGRGTFGT